MVEWPIRLPAGKQKVAALRQSVDYRERRVTERDLMLAPHFHALLRHDPHSRFAVDLGSLGEKHLGCAGGRQDRKFQRAGTDALLLAQLTHEGGNAAEVHRGMMPDRRDLLLVRVDGS